MKIFQSTGSASSSGGDSRCSGPPGKLSPGFTLAELLIVCAIVVILSSVAVSAYSSYMGKARNARAQADIQDMEILVDACRLENGAYPESLNDLQKGTFVDPWGNPYQYLRIEDSDDAKGHKGKGKQRRDRNLNPLNTDYDLYTMGKDAETATQLNSQKGRDDVIRALNGDFVGLASDF